MELISSIFEWLLSALVNIILFGSIFGMLVWAICQALSKNYYDNPKATNDDQTTTTHHSSNHSIHITFQKKK